ncbi:HTTM domain-containing protein [Streptomyces sp. LP05-1]|uniref:HTTM domain-containing protein n=1 Tax=Streptomyces pyxinae TaxID=2970734 RepID=A0ABT2CEU2_9ACTN|nr:HTTM domain-containing protein [Streptomyces sp. LP05-1]MCS0635251.1 HTTM domain-containing protein [Streptomyces sp. LP05-1]
MKRVDHGVVTVNPRADLPGGSHRADWAERAGRGLAGAIQRVTAGALGPYQSAVVRIGFSGAWLLFLLREFPHRRELYGPDGPWSWGMARELIANNHAFSALLWSDSAVWFECVYALAALASLLLLVGWRVRATSVLFLVGVLSLQNRSVFMGDGGDNVVHLMAFYLVLTRCGQVWSLDARRARRRATGTGPGGPGPTPDGAAPAPDTTDSGPDEAEAGPGGTEAGPGAAETGAAETGAGGAHRPVAGRAAADRVGPALWVVLGCGLPVATSFAGRTGESWLLALFWLLWLAQGLWWVVCRYAPGQPRVLLDVLANLAHNAALGVIMAEVCLIYATAGWYKVQGDRWQDGTASYYPFRLDYFTPWPALSGLLAGSGLLIMLATYGTVVVQVAFPFTLFNRRVKNVLLAVMMLEHATIAVLLGLPFFSLAMIAADAVFLPTVFLVWAGHRLVRARDRLRPARRGKVPGPREADGEPAAPRTLVG